MALLPPAALLGCGDHGATVIRWDPPIATDDAGIDREPSLDAGLEPEGGSDDDGRADLCSACTRSSDCGGRNDYCLMNLETGERFCGKDCRDGCPSGYRCHEVDDSARQCVPRTHTCRNASGSLGR